MIHIGIDQHKHFSQVAILDENDQIKQIKLYHDQKNKMKDFFASFQKASITMEATGNWYWLYDLIEPLGLSVQLAHPLKTRAIADARIKTDKIDAKTLAYLDKADLVAKAYCSPPDLRKQRELLRYRLGLVRLRSSIKCKIHALLNQIGLETPALTDLFGKKGFEYLEQLELETVYQKSLEGYLHLIETFSQLIAATDKQIRQFLQKNISAERLMSCPGIGQTIAYLLLAEIGDIHRFQSSQKLCSYAGLVPSVYQSGNRCYTGRITKQGNKYIRWAMVEASQIATTKDPGLKQFYLKIFRKKGAAKARVAVARKLLTAVYHILKNEENYKYKKLTQENMGKLVLGTGKI